MAHELLEQPLALLTLQKKGRFTERAEWSWWLQRKECCDGVIKLSFQSRWIELMKRRQQKTMKKMEKRKHKVQKTRGLKVSYEKESIHASQQDATRVGLPHIPATQQK